jgi:hypothetical protein
MENGPKKRKIEQTEVAKQHDFLAEAAAVFKNARINKLSLTDQNPCNITDVPDSMRPLLPKVSSLTDAYRIQVAKMEILS